MTKQALVACEGDGCSESKAYLLQLEGLPHCPLGPEI